MFFYFGEFQRGRGFLFRAEFRVIDKFSLDTVLCRFFIERLPGGVPSGRGLRTDGKTALSQIAFFELGRVEQVEHEGDNSKIDQHIREHNEGTAGLQRRKGPRLFFITNL